MIRGENSDSIPFDLIIDILSRLPAKSIARFHCVSKLWGSMFLRPYFTDLYLTRSSARPRLLFLVKGDGDEWCFFTSPQPQNLYKESSSLVVTADVHMKFLGGERLRLCGHASGFIYLCRDLKISEEDKHIVPVSVICNPSTGQYTSLSLPKGSRGPRTSFLGFDPIDKQFKVLSMDFDENGYVQILTLGAGNDWWRKIHCPFIHFHDDYFGQGICINGVLYYIAGHYWADRDENSYLIVCFDVRSEKFKFIHRDFIGYYDRAGLINYKGELGVITMKYDLDPDVNSLELCLWIIKDVEKPESVDVYTLRDSNIYNFWYDSIVGMTATGDIVFKTHTSEPLYVLFFNPERNTLLNVEIQGFGAALEKRRRRRRRSKVENHPKVVGVFVEHVEDLKFITMKTASTSPSGEKREPTSTSTTSSKAPLQCDESINKFDLLRLLDDDEFT